MKKFLSLVLFGILTLSSFSHASDNLILRCNVEDGEFNGVKIEVLYILMEKNKSNAQIDVFLEDRSSPVRFELPYQGRLDRYKFSGKLYNNNLTLRINLSRNMDTPRSWIGKLVTNKLNSEIYSYILLCSGYEDEFPGR